LDISLDTLTNLGIPVDLSDRESLLSCVNTCLSSKVVSSSADILSPIAVDSVLNIVKDGQFNVDLRNIRVVKKLGGTIDDTKMVEGIVFTDNKPAHSAGGPTRIENAKIALI